MEEKNMLISIWIGAKYYVTMKAVQPYIEIAQFVRIRICIKRNREAKKIHQRLQEMKMAASILVNWIWI